ncbi:exodeoxyribonuclease VII small subunit [Eubacterium oxidoreducens]|uniref:Exodeoxyribonuclease 7 small subunit n=1 Tax=Eubacterium oxidoreducens TaxID=1732 RepID=A0A1G6AJW8_EUBOX|nr:exodeoxyribonuclease VII small subunit [Eubacterium oxidoreducens]SDB08659.1 Exodeoxyribonuclease VII small subunit [Eubacterium oxidoreducens]
MSEEKKDYSLEELFEQVESLLSKMEQKEVSLEDSFEFYEQGMNYLKLCKDKIDCVEKKMEVINAQNELIE